MFLLSARKCEIYFSMFVQIIPKCKTMFLIGLYEFLALFFWIPLHNSMKSCKFRLNAFFFWDRFSCRGKLWFPTRWPFYLFLFFWECINMLWKVAIFDTMPFFCFWRTTVWLIGGFTKHKLWHFRKDFKYFYVFSGTYPKGENLGNTVDNTTIFS